MHDIRYKTALYTVAYFTFTSTEKCFYPVYDKIIDKTNQALSRIQSAGNCWGRGYVKEHWILLVFNTTSIQFSLGYVRDSRGNTGEPFSITLFSPVLCVHEIAKLVHTTVIRIKGIKWWPIKNLLLCGFDVIFFDFREKTREPFINLFSLGFWHTWEMFVCYLKLV